MDGGKDRGRRQGIRLGEPWNLTVCMGKPPAEENSVVFSQRRKLWGATVVIHPLRRVQYLQPYPAGDTAKGCEPLRKPPSDRRIPCSHHDVVHVPVAWLSCSCETTIACPDGNAEAWRCSQLI